MASRLDQATTASVVTLAGFQLLTAWNANAPSLSDVRAAKADGGSIHQQLVDADIMVGGLAIILGVAYAVLSHDITALVIMAVIFGTISLWSHSVLNAESR